MARKRIRKLSKDDQQSLVELGVTSSQVAEIERNLDYIGDMLAPQPAANDVQAVLSEVRRLVDRLARIVDAAEKGSAAHMQALGELELLIGLDLSSAGELDAAGLTSFAKAVRELRLVASIAAEQGPKQQRHGRNDPGLAVEGILNALNKPKDQASVAFAKRVKPTATPSKSNPFGEIAVTVFCAATGKTSGIRAAVDHWRESRAADRGR